MPRNTKAPAMCGRLVAIENCDGSEPVVYAEAEHARLEPVLHAGEHVATILEPYIEVLGAGRPVRRQADLDAAADGPAEMALRLGEGPEIDAPAAIGQTAGRVDEHVVHRIAGAATDRAKPRIGELVGREGVVRARALDVGL